MMIAKSTVLLSVGVLFMVYYASSARVTYNNFMSTLYNDTLQYKHPRCYAPYPNSFWNQNVLYRNIANVKAQRWYYDPFTRTCRPFFTYANYTYVPEDKNYNLPHTRIECETLCGSYCIVDRADGRTELGICMAFELGASVPNSCKNVLPEAHPRQCPQTYSRCCPRSYRHLIDTPVNSQTAVAPDTAVSPPGDDRSRRPNRSAHDDDVATHQEPYVDRDDGFSM